MKEIIIDVRTPEEFKSGNAKCSVNYPLNELPTKIEELRQYESIKIVCRSGARAGTAQMMLMEAGITNVQNLGPWQMAKCD
jgi:rhodanese-related sulfurtransferase